MGWGGFIFTRARVGGVAAEWADWRSGLILYDGLERSCRQEILHLRLMYLVDVLVGEC